MYAHLHLSSYPGHPVFAVVWLVDNGGHFDLNRQLTFASLPFSKDR